MRFNLGFCVLLLAAWYNQLRFCFADIDTKSPNQKLQFAPLPKSEPYLLDEENNDWGLKGLTNIASGLALAVRNEPPYDIIGNVLSKSFGQGGKSPSISEVIDYELPLIVLASFSLLAAIVIPITGLVFCCCRCKGKCGGSLDENKLIVHPTKQRIAYSLGILLCAFFLILAGGFVLSSSVKMSKSIPQARTVWQQSFGDIGTYTHNTLKELNHIAVQEAVPTVAVLLNDVIDIGRAIVVPVIEKGSTIVEPLFHSISDIDKAVSKSLQLLGEIQKTTSSLMSSGDALGNELSNARQNLTKAKDQCVSDGRASACDVIPGDEGLKTDANFTKVPNVTETQMKVEDVTKTNLTNEAVKGNESFHDIPDKSQNLTTNLTQNFKNFSSKIDDVQADVLKPLQDDIDEYLKDVLNPIRDEVDDKYLGPDGMLTKYDKYRHIIFILLGILILLDGVLLIIAVLLGLIGATTYDTPGHRSNVADWGGRLMIGAAGLFFFSAFLINLLVGILFLLGANIAIVCDDVPDYKLLEKTIDDPKVMGEYLLGKMLLKDGDIKLTVSGVLSGCGKNEAPWHVFKMDHLYNLTDVLNYKDEIPSIDEVFGELNKTVEDTVVMSDDAKEAVNDSLNAGVQDINYIQFHQQVNKPLVVVPLPSFVTNVSKAANETKSVSQSTSDKLKETAESLQHVHDTIVTPAMEQAAILGRLVNEVELQGKAIEESWKRVKTNLAEVEQFLKTEALSIAAAGLSTHWHTVFNDVDYFLAYVIRQVRFDVGQCRPLTNIYRGLTGSVCHHYAAGMNASWVAFGLCAVFLLISIILCVRASKHFRQMANCEEISGEGVQRDMMELPWMDGDTRQHEDQVLVTA